MSQVKQIPVELGVCFADSGWRRAIVFIPEATHTEFIQDAATLAYLDKDNEAVVEHTWVQCYGPELAKQIKAAEAA